jgi:hypothetical protein
VCVVKPAGWTAFEQLLLEFYGIKKHYPCAEIEGGKDDDTTNGDGNSISTVSLAPQQCLTYVSFSNISIHPADNSSAGC